MKTLTHPITGRRVMLGRKRPSPQLLDRRLSFDRYVPSTLPKAPAGPLKRDALLMAVVRQMYGNDTAGDCTIAGKAKLIGAFTGLANPPAVIFDTATVLAEYSRLTKPPYDPADPSTDTGLDEMTVLDDWRTSDKSCLGAHNIAAVMSVDASNVEHMKLAVYLFGNGYLGLELPDAYVSPIPSANGFTWGVAGESDPENGHCIVAIDYTQAGLIVLTWGLWGVLTWDACAKYLAASDGGEFHVVLSHEIINRASAKAPSAFDFAQLQADLPQVGK